MFRDHWHDRRDVNAQVFFFCKRGGREGARIRSNQSRRIFNTPRQNQHMRYVWFSRRIGRLSNIDAHQGQSPKCRVFPGKIVHQIDKMGSFTLPPGGWSYCLHLALQACPFCTPSERPYVVLVERLSAGWIDYPDPRDNAPELALEWNRCSKSHAKCQHEPAKSRLSGPNFP